MTNPNEKCDICGYEGESGVEVVNGVCEDCGERDELQKAYKERKESQGENIKSARHIGYSYLHDRPQIRNDLWSCPYCNSMFNADKEHRRKIHKCIDCKKKILLNENNKI